MIRKANETTAHETPGNKWTHWSDEELLLEYRSTGIREAFDELVYRYERELYNYLYRYLGHSANADDVFQKTFLTVMEQCGTFDTSRKFRPWLYKIATNEATDHMRKAKQRCYSMVSIDAPTEGNVTNTIAKAAAGREPEPFENAMEREIAGKVREAVDALPERMRQAVYMVYFQGLSYREAADAADVCLATVSSRLQSAIVKLNFLLKNVG